MRILLAVICATLLVSCGEGPRSPQRWVDNLVQRFNVPDCADATLLRGGRNPDVSKPGAMWIYAAGDDCIADMKAAFAIIGFERVGASTYRYASQNGWYELVELAPSDDTRRATIIWETIDP
jgi:hypothetical protein